MSAPWSVALAILTTCCGRLFYRCEGFWRGITRAAGGSAGFICFIGVLFVGLSWGSVCEAMHVYRSYEYALNACFSNRACRFILRVG